MLKKAYIATPHIAGYSTEGKLNGTKMIAEECAKKFKFSAENWDDFKNLDVKTLKRFTCIYSQYIASDFDTSDFTAIRNIIGRVEGAIIDELQPRCNKQGVTKPRDNGMEESMKVIREEMKKAMQF